jgi:hypothetical protein
MTAPAICPHQSHHNKDLNDTINHHIIRNSVRVYHVSRTSRTCYCSSNFPQDQISQEAVPHVQWGTCGRPPMHIMLVSSHWSGV